MNRIKDATVTFQAASGKGVMILMAWYGDTECKFKCGECLRNFRVNTEASINCSILDNTVAIICQHCGNTERTQLKGHTA